MSGDYTFVIALSLFTLVAVGAAVFWQLRSVRKSQAARHEEPGEVHTAHLRTEPELVAAAPVTAAEVKQGATQASSPR